MIWPENCRHSDRHCPPSPPGEVCGQHNSGGSHHQGWWDSLRERGRTSGYVVQWQQHPVECQQDKGDCLQRGHTQHLPLIIDGAAVECAWWFLECTSVRTSPEPPTLHHWPRKPSSAFTSYTNWSRPVPHHPSWPRSTEWPLTASTPATVYHCVGQELRDVPSVSCKCMLYSGIMHATTEKRHVQLHRVP